MMTTGGRRQQGRTGRDRRFAGFEQTDVKVTGIVVFLTALGIFVVVTAVLSYGIGMVINAQ